ncbi:hypothetical protein [Actinophytocola sp.]|uniref:hypothetical protein n=1 Tax=Actinophytocola sp. TaxID=1872138 RepID=UPI002ED509A3
MDVTPHPLLAVLHAAAAGAFPPADGRALFLPPLPNRQAAVVSLTGRVYLATDHRPPDLDGFGSALHPAVLRQLAGPHGEIGTLDVTLASQGLGGGTLPARHDLADHPRVRHAHAIREAVRVYGDNRGLVTIAAGLAGRTEISVEVFSTTGAGQGDGSTTAEEQNAATAGTASPPVDNPVGQPQNCRCSPVAWFEGPEARPRTGVASTPGPTTVAPIPIRPAPATSPFRQSSPVLAANPSVTPGPGDSTSAPGGMSRVAALRRASVPAEP